MVTAREAFGRLGLPMMPKPLLLDHPGPGGSLVMSLSGKAGVLTWRMRPLG